MSNRNCCCRPAPCGTTHTLEGIVPVVYVDPGYGKLPPLPFEGICCETGGGGHVNTGGAAAVFVTKIVDADYAIGIGDPNELKGGIIYVTGPATLTLPPISTGMHCRVITIGATEVFIAPDPSDKIILDGKTSLVDGDRILNVSWPGDWANLSYFNGDGWSAITNGWSNAG